VPGFPISCLGHWGRNRVLVAGWAGLVFGGDAEIRGPRPCVSRIVRLGKTWRTWQATSPAGAAWKSPVRKCRVAEKQSQRESRRDDTRRDAPEVKCPSSYGICRRSEGIVQVLQRILDAIKSRWPPHPQMESLRSDLTTKFPHPANRHLFSFLRRDWREGRKAESRRNVDEYPLRAHPDLIEFFRNLTPSTNVVSGSAYGHPVMANSAGLIFAWAGGTNYVMLRMPSAMRQQAVDEGGRFDPTYGDEWIEFLAWKQRLGQQKDWREALARWIQIAYQESLKLIADP
jgi:hypothetical protein